MTNINILFPQEEAEKHKVNYKGENKSIVELMQGILAKSDLDFSFSDERQILVYLSEKRYRRPTKFQGKLIDSLSGDAIIGAQIKELVSNQVTYSNDYGIFHLSTNNTYLELEIYAFGYNYCRRKLPLESPRSDNIIFMQSVFALPEITVSSQKKEWDQIFYNSILPQDVAKSPALLGETDLFKTLFRTSGVTSGADGFGGLNVRGATNDHNLIMMDDVPVYYPSHAIGLLSIFNTEAVKSAKFYPGFVPSKFGGRLSSVLDVHTKEGNNREWKADGSLGFLTAKLAVEGPLVKNKLSVFSSYRRTILDPFIKGLSRYAKERERKTGSANYFFFDLNSKVRWSLSERDHLYLSFYNGQDAYSNFEDEVKLQTGFVHTARRYDHLQWGNRLYSLRYNRNWKSNVFTHLVVYQSSFDNVSEQFDAFLLERANERIDSLLLGRSFYSNIKENGGYLHVQFNPFVRNWVHTGFQFQLQKFSPSAFSYNEKAPIVADIKSYRPFRMDSLTRNNFSTLKEFNFYAEDHFQFGTQSKLIAGIRSSAIFQGPFSWAALQPRLMLSLALGKHCFAGLSYVNQFQSLHLLSSSAIGLPTDLWVPSQNQVRPQRGHLLSANVNVTTSPNHRFSVEAYVKHMKHLIYIKEGANFALGVHQNWEEEITKGYGDAMGIEIASHFQNRWLYVEQNVTLSKSVRRFEGINFGNDFNFRFDRPLVYHLTATYQYRPHLSINLEFEYAKGNPVSLPIGEYEYISNTAQGNRVEVLVFKEVNNARLPDVIRLNAGLRYAFYRKNMHQELQFGVYNILNRRNPVYLELVADPAAPNMARLNQISLIPLLPSLQYRFYFK